MRSGPPARERKRAVSAQARSPHELEALLRDLGPAIRRGMASADRTRTNALLHPTGLLEVDRLLGGGFPQGRLCEVTGSSSCGRTSLAFSLLAGTTRAGHCVALVDCADAFDPASASDRGVQLERVLWIRPRGLDAALRCSERLLATDGFPLVLLDLADRMQTGSPAAREARDARRWLRLARRAAGAHSTLIVLSDTRCAGTSAHVAIVMRPARAHFSRGPALFEGLEVEVELTRHRTRPVGRRAALRLGSHAA